LAGQADQVRHPPHQAAGRYHDPELTALSSGSALHGEQVAQAGCSTDTSMIPPLARTRKPLSEAC
jgi:hypothetical protein